VLAFGRLGKGVPTALLNLAAAAYALQADSHDALLEKITNCKSLLVESNPRIDSSHFSTQNSILKPVVFRFSMQVTSRR